MTKEMIEFFLTYNPLTGVFIWKKRELEMFKTHRAFIQWNKRYAGTIAGSVKNNGYIFISIKKKIIRAHRLAWLITYGEWPVFQIDHINGNPSDNSINNLRDVPASVNAKNKRLFNKSSTGFSGVYLHQNGKFRVKGMVDNSQKHIGYFVNLQDAVKARKVFEANNGFHANHGRAEA